MVSNTYKWLDPQLFTFSVDRHIVKNLSLFCLTIIQVPQSASYLVIFQVPNVFQILVHFVL